MFGVHQTRHLLRSISTQSSKGRLRVVRAWNVDNACRFHSSSIRNAPEPFEILFLGRDEFSCIVLEQLYGARGTCRLRYSCLPWLSPISALFNAPSSRRTILLLLRVMDLSGTHRKLNSTAELEAICVISPRFSLYFVGRIAIDFVALTKKERRLATDLHRDASGRKGRTPSDAAHCL